MAFGLFGKLPQKRDFVALGIPQAVLHPYETWLQTAVAASRSELGRTWEQYFSVAPIWRFWIGHEIFGQACAGALMPSVDKVGRYFPMTVMHTGAPGAEDAPPPFAPRDEWYTAIEARLLAVLDEDAAVEVETLTAGLAAPAPVAAPPPAPEAFKGGYSWSGPVGGDGATMLGELVEADYWRAAATRSFWWTPGGGQAQPLVHVRPGLPDPYFFTRMLTGPAA